MSCRRPITASSKKKQAPARRSATPGVLDLLRRYESRNVTFMEPDGSWPMVWRKAQGNYVWDAHGKRYLDLTAAFGVAAAGHANRKVVRAGQNQMRVLLHAMGDVHPHELKARLARELSRLTSSVGGPRLVAWRVASRENDLLQLRIRSG